MIAEFHNKKSPVQKRREEKGRKKPLNMLDLSQLAHKIGFTTLAVKLTTHSLKNHIPLPCILHWNQNHYVVLYKIGVSRFLIADPAVGPRRLKQKDFDGYWLGKKKKRGIALILSP